MQQSNIPGGDAAGPLAGRRVVVPETRDLEVLARMLERQGAAAIRCPLVAILDAPDQAPVAAWLRRFITMPPDALVLLTGEGLSRLVAAAERLGLQAEFLAALARCRRITRGPKPVGRLRALGLGADLQAAAPTTAGVIETLAALDLRGQRVAVQLYPDNPNAPLMQALAAQGASIDAVVPYAYASAADDARVLAALRAMAGREVDLVVFTSSPQLRRLRDVAKAAGEPALLQQALERTLVAAVGPLVAEAVREAGGRVAVVPEASFHMKPMVTALVSALAHSPAKSSVER